MTNQLSYTIVAIIVLFYQNLYIGLLSLLAIIIVSVIENKFIKNIQPLIKDRASRNITFSKIFRESISNITLFKYLGINQNIIDKVSNLDDKRNTKNRVLSKKQNIYYAIRNLIVTIFNLLIVVFSIYLYYKGYITQGIIVVVIFSV
ncbi:MAG: ABC transporter transmembrane domain-containing protein [Cyanobium sp. MAG06]|nr:ABC transporter transmembrane domain-containing protein [Cyanobium sp. MAG06]